VPVSATVCGLDVPFSSMVRAPVRVPRAAGEKVVAIVQLAPAAKVAGLAGQVLVV